MENNGQRKAKSSSEILPLIRQIQHHDLPELSSDKIEEEKIERNNQENEQSNNEFSFSQVIKETESPKEKIVFNSNDEEINQSKMPRRRSTSRHQSETELIPNMEYSTSSVKENVQSNQEAIVIGICAREKKTTCKPMKNILKHLEFFNQFQIKVFTDEQILNQDISQ